MKKVILPLLAAMVASLAFSGCSNYDDSVVARVRTTYYTIEKNAWKPVVDNSTGQVVSYYAECYNSNIDFTNGVVTAYLCADEGDKALPYTIYNAQTDEDGNYIEWEDHLSYDVQQNGITFILESSDFTVYQTLNGVDGQGGIGALQFKVCVVRNEYLR